MAKKKKLRLKKKVKRFLKRTVVLIILIIFVANFKKIFKSTQATDISQVSDSSNRMINSLSNNLTLIKGEEYIIADRDNYNSHIDDESIISYESGVIKALNKGETKINLSNNSNNITLNVFVTDLLVLPTVNNKKAYLKCHQYSETEASELDKVLENRINQKGYQTRAGAVEAVRFLTLMFPYRIKYFYENGRLDKSNSFFDYVDGEGRYYHKGLYLTDNKFKDLKATLRGPNPWGCEIYNDTGKGNRVNGLDCSGFITWALLNAGYDPGDVGAGINDYNDITDIGKVVLFTDNDSFNNVKVGDLVGRQGHIAMLIGIKDGKYYIGEALDAGEYDMHVYSYTKDELIKSHFKYFVYLDDYYKEDGILTDIW